MQITPEQLGEVFAGVLKSWLTKEQWGEMRARNVEHVDDGVCASHDFVDANMAMLEAFLALGLHDPSDLDCDSPARDLAMDLWSKAWDWAKANRLTKSNLPRPRISPLHQRLAEAGWVRDGEVRMGNRVQFLWSHPVINPGRPVSSEMADYATMRHATRTRG